MRRTQHLVNPDSPLMGGGNEGEVWDWPRKSLWCETAGVLGTGVNDCLAIDETWVRLIDMDFSLMGGGNEGEVAGLAIQIVVI